MQEYEQYYENVVNYFINQYKWKAMIIPYKEFIAGYSLFALGIELGFEHTTSILSDFLENADVQQITTNTELQKYYGIMAMLQQKKEEQKSKGV